MGISKFLQKVFAQEAASEGAGEKTDEQKMENIKTMENDNNCCCGGQESTCGTDNTAQNQEAVKTARKVCHCYFEVGGELLAKPNALCDILESKGLPRSLIFCNSPSDTDFVEVLLKKRGIGASKLIGYVPPAKVERTMERLQSRDITTVVITDIAARGLDLNIFDLTVNYSIPADAETYVSRSGLTESSLTTECASKCGAENSRCVASLISPLDITGFHTIKKNLPIEFQKQDLPQADGLLKSRAENLRQQALTKAGSLDELTRKFAQVILDTPDKESIVAMLLHNTLEVIPQLNASIDRASWEKEAEEGEEEQQPGGRYGRREGRDRRGGGGREGRDRRGGRRDDRDDRRRPRRGGRDEYEEMDEEQPMRADEESRESRADETDEYQPHHRREPLAPRAKEDRLYIGVGSAEGFSEEKLLDLLKSNCEMGSEEIKRFSLRNHYSFVDIPEEKSAKVVENLAAADLFIKKAVTIVAPRERRDEGEGSETQTESDDHAAE